MGASCKIGGSSRRLFLKGADDNSVGDVKPDDDNQPGAPGNDNGNGKPENPPGQNKDKNKDKNGNRKP